MEKSKLVFVLPELTQASSGHSWHIIDLLTEASKELDILLFIEKSEDGLKLPTSFKVIRQRYSFLPLRIAERKLMFLKLQLQGYKNFYIHQSVFSSILASMIGKCTGTRTFFWYAGKITIYEKEEGRKNWLFRLNLRLVDYLVTANKDMKQYYIENFGMQAEKIKILPGWVNIQRFAKVDSKQLKDLKKTLPIENKKVILFAHAISQRKGSRFLPEIIQKTIDLRKDVMFLIIGNGPDFRWLKSELTKRKLQKYYFLAGEVPHQDMPLYYHLADVFIMPSREEELGRVQLEAMAAGLPVVAFDNEGPRNIFTKEEINLLIDKYNISDYTNKIIYALNHNKKYCESFAHTARNYCISKVAKKYNQMIL